MLVLILNKMKNLTPIITIAVLFLGTLFVHAQEDASPAPKLDFGDFSSATLTGKAWAAYGKKQYVEAEAYAAKCIEMYQKEALEQQASLTAPAPAESVHDYWALNDVGTSYYIRGQSYDAEGKMEKALADFNYLATNLSFAQCWDTKGWFWSPADAAKARIKALEFDAL